MLRATLLVLALLVGIWRASVLASVLGGPGTTSGVTLDLALGAMGLCFLGLGLATFWRVGSPAAALFALYGVFAGLHWGGPLHVSEEPLKVQISEEPLQAAITLGYLVLSSVLAESLFLHLTLAFPDRWRILGLRRVILALYLPVALAGLAALAIFGSPDQSAWRTGSTTAFSLIHALQTNLYHLLAIIVIAIRLRRASADERRRVGLGVLLVAVVAPGLLYVAVQLVNALAPGSINPAGLGTEPINLCFVATPAGYAYAIARTGR